MKYPGRCGCRRAALGARGSRARGAGRRHAARRRERPHRPHELPELRGRQRAELFLLPVPFSTGGGTLSPPIADVRRPQRHRHPTWSPDRTKIAYARGASRRRTRYDIFVQDLTQPAERHESGQHHASRPRLERGPARVGAQTATHIAFERGQRRSRRAGTSCRLGLQTGVARPTSRTRRRHRGQAGVGPDLVDHLLREGERTDPGRPTRTSSSGRSPSPVEPPRSARRRSPWRTTPTDPEIQPAISPRRRQDLLRDRLPRRSHHRHQGGGAHGPARAAGRRSRSARRAYYCTWSPDNTMVAYTAGAGARGRPGDGARGRLESSSRSRSRPGPTSRRTPTGRPTGGLNAPTAARPRRAGRPSPSRSPATDTGPAYERTDVRGVHRPRTRRTGPRTQEFAGDPVTYTPNAGLRRRSTPSRSGASTSSDSEATGAPWWSP